MKKVPSNVSKSAPPGTEWFGGSVDKIVTSLRVTPKGDESGKELNSKKIEDIISKKFERRKRGWFVEVKPCFNGNMDKQIRAIINKIPNSKKFWDSLSELAEIDLFVGVFLEMPNRGMKISPTSMQLLAERNIVVSLDIYSPDEH